MNTKVARRFLKLEISDDFSMMPSRSTNLAVFIVYLLLHTKYPRGFH